MELEFIAQVLITSDVTVMLMKSAWKLLSYAVNRYKSHGFPTLIYSI